MCGCGCKYGWIDEYGYDERMDGCWMMDGYRWMDGYGYDGWMDGYRCWMMDMDG